MSTIASFRKAQETRDHVPTTLDGSNISSRGQTANVSTIPTQFNHESRVSDTQDHLRQTIKAAQDYLEQTLENHEKLLEISAFPSSLKEIRDELESVTSLSHLGLLLNEDNETKQVHTLTERANEIESIHRQYKGLYEGILLATTFKKPQQMSLI